MSLTVVEQLNNSVLNLHVATSFFAGITFCKSFSCLALSPFWFDLVHIIRGRSFDGIEGTVIFNVDLESRMATTEGQGVSKLDGAASRIALGKDEFVAEEMDSLLVTLVLPLLFLLASLVQFVSSFALMSNSGGICAFLIAWFDVLFQSGRIVGLYSIVVSLRKLGLRQMETIAAFIGLLIVIALLITNTVFSFGFIGPIPDICYRKHSLGPSIALSSVAIVTESSCIIWLFKYLDYASGQNRRCRLVKDFRVKRIAALLAFDSIGLVTNSIKSITIAGFIPFSVAALIVLVAFGHRPSVDAVRQSAKRTSTTSVRERELARPPSQAPAPPLKDNISSGFSTPSPMMTSKEVASPIHSGAPQVKTNQPEAEKKLSLPEQKAPSSTRFSSSQAKEKRLKENMTQTTKSEDRVEAKQQATQSFMQPIMPKDELMRRFLDNEQVAVRVQTTGLPYRPAAKVSPPQSEPLESLVRPRPQTPRRHSLSGESGKALTLGSSIYGSDIIRPPPGKVVHDRMKSSSPSVPGQPKRPKLNDKPKAAQEISAPSERPRARPTKGPPVVKIRPAHGRSGSTSDDSWKSDHSPVSRRPQTLPRFDFEGLGGWPKPPDRVPTPEDVLKLREQRQKKRSSSSRSRTRMHTAAASASLILRRRATPVQKPPPGKAVPPRPPRPEDLFLYL